MTETPGRTPAGQSDALRRGFARASGEILGWLNADDLLMPHAVAHVVEVFRSTPPPDVVYGHCALLDENGQFLRYFHEIQPFSAEVLHNRLNFIAQPATFFRRTAYERVGGVDEALHYVMDWDLWCRFAAAGYRFAFADEVLAAARHYGETKTSGGGRQRQAEILRLNRRYKTTRLPVAAAAHGYHDLVKARFPALHAPLRAIWRTLNRRRFLEPTDVHGFAFPDRIVASPAQIHFPVFADLAGARLVLTAEPAAPLSATLNGRPGSAQHDAAQITVTWHFDEPLYAPAVAVDILLAASPKTPLDAGFSPGRLVEMTIDMASPPGTPSAES